MVKDLIISENKEKKALAAQQNAVLLCSDTVFHQPAVKKVKNPQTRSLRLIILKLKSMQFSQKCSEVMTALMLTKIRLFVVIKSSWILLAPVHQRNNGFTRALLNKDIFHLMDMIKPFRRHGLYKEVTRKFSDILLFEIDEEDKKATSPFLPVLVYSPCIKN